MENVYEYFVQFRRAAKKAKWSPERIEAVLTDAERSDYDGAVGVLLAAMDKIEKEAARRLNRESMSPETKLVLKHFETVTGLKPSRFHSNRHSMRFWFS